jgi:gamma-glutamyl-gamma-aminobutyrate hydrolase PuuD
MRLALVSTRIIESSHKEPHFSVSKDLVKLLSGFGFDSILVTEAIESANELIASLKPELIVLSGGEDVGVNLDRDNLEYELLRESIPREIPVLGICRGMQIISTFLGGELFSIENHVGDSHQVNNSDGTRSFKVNSFHNFAVSNISDDLEVDLTSVDGVIESVRHKNYPWLGIMWHPERKGNDAASMEILEEFFKAK